MTLTLTQQQGEALYVATHFLHKLHEARKLASDDGMTPEGWFGFWQPTLATANSVARMCEGKEPPRWSSIALVCQVAADFISQMPSTHNVHQLAPATVLEEVRALAEERSAA